MKIKLLKRLRKEAKMRYRIKRIDGEYCLIITDMGIFGYIYRPNVSYKYLKDAKNVCNCIRRKYILDEVRRIRNKQGKFINF